MSLLDDLLDLSRIESGRLELERIIDLITVAEAAHWLPLPAFYNEIRRIARPGVVIAMWSYGLNIAEAPVLEAVIDQVVRGPLGPWWPESIRHIHDRYQTLAFPFPEVNVPPFNAITEGSLESLLGLMRTWSASSRHYAAHDTDPLADHRPALRRAWKRVPTEVRRLRWPLFVRAGRVHG